MISIASLALMLLSGAPAPQAAPATQEPMKCEHGDAAQAPAKLEGTFAKGNKVPAENAVAVKDLLAAPEKHAGKAVVVEGAVRQVCQKMGCWVELAESKDAKGPGVRVMFKGFVVPKDSAGASARLLGTVKIAELSEEKAKRYASEGASVARGADGKAREVQVVATGIELHR